MKIYLNKANENWIVDRFRSEWYKYNSDISTRFINNADIIWVISPWTWNKINEKHLKNKKVVVTNHHIDLKNWNPNEKNNFYELDKFVDVYHTISNKSLITLKQVTNKEVLNIPFWANNEIFFEIKDKDKLREKYKINRENFLIGSFQRDSEGMDLTKPKLIKGPDIFISAIKKLSENNKNIEVILSGNRRNYIIKELQKNNIEYRYFKNINNTKLNELYNMLDMYIVSSRLEGGPQAILECGLTKTPLISTDVGIASQILHTKSIFSTNPQNATPDTDYAYQNTLNLAIPNGMKKFRSELSKL
jgi:glycosyltransferase involved in cell wall biosynthesis